MIVCVCHNVSERRVEHALASGASCMADLRRELKLGTSCGKCARQCRQMLNASVTDGADGMGASFAVAA